MPSFQKGAAKMLALLSVLSIVPTTVIAETTTGFSDVNAESTPYVDAIEYLKDNNIIQGYADGNFKPDATINRAEFTKILIGASGAVVKGSNCFPDVTDEWFAPYVCTAKTLGVVGGYDDGTFKPAEPINFAEAAKIIATTFKLTLGDTDPSVWFKKYIEALQADYAIPLSVDYFDENITRDEMSEIIWRLKTDVKNKSSRTYGEINGDGLITASSCADLEERMKYIQQPYPIFYDIMPMPAMAPAVEDMAAPAESTKSSDGMGAVSAGAGADEYSSTNLQELGVDEADVIKNDGKYIYLIKNNTLRIIDAYPASSMKEIINFQLGPQSEGFYPSEMYINNDQLIVMGSSSVSYPIPLDDTVTSSKSMIMPPYYGGSRSKVYIVDVTDRTKPKVTRTVDFDGNYTTSRRVGDTLYLVLNQYQYFPYYRGSEPVSNLTDYLPKMSDSANGGKDQLVADCSKVLLMPKPKTSNFLITAAIPLKDTAKDVSRNVIVGSGENVYASTSNLYVASTDWSGPYYYNNGQTTKLYRFSLGNGQIKYAAHGQVAGTILNQFSMDEYQSNFRIATTESSTVMGNTKTSNNVFILNSSLKNIGQLTDLASGERIYSVRFMGNRGYLVTFKNVDPLFVIDLATPSNPKVLGQLKIPGYSDYLHPYDETHLIGFGKDVDPEEAAKNKDFVYYTAVKGFKMGLFDVSDPTHPQELFHEIIGDQGTYSELLYNHEALLFDKEKNLIAFPITVTAMPADEPICSDYKYSNCPSGCYAVCEPTCTYENGITICDENCDGANSCQASSYTYPETVFIGAYVYGVDLEKGFQLKGKITHLNQSEVSDLLENGYGNWEKTIQRIIYMGNTLYTVSQGEIMANDLANALKEIKMIELTGSLYNIKYGAEPVLQE